jgi:TPR repeat protein
MKFFKPATSIFILTTLVSCTGHDDPKLAFEKGKYEIAYELWLPRAQDGDLEAQNYLGIQYALGLGVSKNYKEAVKWYEHAARAGYPDAQRNYGDMFQFGRGVPQDYYQAFIWYFAASQQGHETAKRLIESLTGNNKLTPNQQMHAKLEANKYIQDPAKRFTSHDTYILNK